MPRRRAALSAVCLLLGVAVVASVPYRVWLPTVADPNYWANHTGGLLPLVMQAMVGGGLVVAGVALGFAGAARRLRGADVRTAGVAGVVGGLLGYGPLHRAVADPLGTGPAAYYGLGAAAFALLAAGAVGLGVRYHGPGRPGRYGAGVLVGGFVALAGAELLGVVGWVVEPRSGALSYPPYGLELVGTLALAAGAVALGVSLRRDRVAPAWLAPLLVVVGVLAVPLGVVAFLQNRWADGLVGLAWVAIGTHLAVARDQPGDG